MRFGPVPLDQAEGAILAHSVDLPALRLRKGQRLGAADLAALRAGGVARVTVARLDPGDVHEDTAATRLAAAVGGGAPGLRASVAATGRVNLHATGPGLLRVEAGRVDALNLVDPAITLATLRPLARVGADDLVATIKIIPYAVADTALARAETAGAAALALAPPVLRRASLVETLAGRDLGDKGARAVAGRLAALEVTLADSARVAHAVEPLARALRAAAGEMLLILTASATSDIDDVAPAALRAAGGRVHHFGMPVDPGNLLFLGDLDGRRVVGLPGCARSPALNGADWVMNRLICGIPVTPGDIMGLGVGGLLKEIPSRPRPRLSPPHG